MSKVDYQNKVLPTLLINYDTCISFGLKIAHFQLYNTKNSMRNE